MKQMLAFLILVGGLVIPATPAMAISLTGVPLIPPNGSGSQVGDVAAAGQMVLFSIPNGDFSPTFVWDRSSGEVVEVGLADQAAISADGKFVIYLPPRSDGSLFDKNVVVYEVATGARTTVNRRTDDGTVSGSDFVGLSMTSDTRGVRAFFSVITSLSPLDNNEVWDTYAYDFETGTTTLVTVDSAGDAAGSSAFVSQDGNFVLYGPEDAAIRRNLVSGELVTLGSGNGQWGERRCDWISQDGRHVRCIEQLELDFTNTRDTYQTVLWDVDTDTELILAGYHRWSPDLSIRTEEFQTAVDQPIMVSVYRDGESDQQLPSTTSILHLVRNDGVLVGEGSRNQPGVEVWYSEVGSFSDDEFSIFEPDIEWLAAAGVTRGCNPPINDMFCPNDAMTRGQTAAFLHRSLPDLPEVRPAIDFTDDDDSIFERDIEWLHSVGVTQGTSATTFNPGGAVTRGQMAAFLVRALKYTDAGGGDLFTDDDTSIFGGDIDRLGTAGVTRGCNPPTNDMFCPDAPVTRGQMAAFLHRALGG